MINRNLKIKKDLKGEILKALNVLEKTEDIIEIRMLKTKYGTISGYYKNKDKLINDIMKYDGKDNIFFTLNELSDEAITSNEDKLNYKTIKTTSDKDIKKRKLLLIDIDPCRATGTSSTTKELECANEVSKTVKEYLEKQGFPSPVKACSGNGYHLLYKLDLPNEKRITDKIKAFLKALDENFSTKEAKVDTANYNASRICKLYGTIACKGENTAERPHRRSRIIAVPQTFEFVSEEMLDKIIGSQLNKKEEKKIYSKDGCTYKGKKIDLKEWLEKNNIEISHTKPWDDGICYVLKTCPWNPKHEDNNSAYVIQYGNGAISASCHHDSCRGKKWSDLKALYENKDKKTTINSNENYNDEKRSQADMLIDACQQSEDTFFQDEYGENYVAIKNNNGNPKILSIEGEEYKNILTTRLYRCIRKTPSRDSINSAIALLKAFAYNNPKIKLQKRCYMEDNVLYYDLCNENYDIIKVTPNGWDLDKSGKILFTRNSTMEAQVTPIKYDDISIINKHYRFKTEEDEILHITTLLTTFLDISHPMVIYYGEKGASKTTTMKMDRLLVDPSLQGVIALPRKNDDLALYFYNNYMACFDNMEYLSNETSNQLCMAITGGGITKRKLYTNGEICVYEYKVPIIVNGINVVATKSDLLDRSLLIGLDRIPDDERKEEREVWKEFKKDKPKILGAIFTILSKAMTIYPNVKLNKLGRMADYVRWGYAITQACGIDGDKFLEAYNNNQNKINDEVVDCNPIATAVFKFMEFRNIYEESASKLLNELNTIAELENIDVRSGKWAKEPNVLSRRLNELKSNLRLGGIEFSTSNTNTGRKIRLEKIGKKVEVKEIKNKRKTKTILGVRKEDIEKLKEDDEF